VSRVYCLQSHLQCCLPSPSVTQLAHPLSVRDSFTILRHIGAIAPQPHDTLLFCPLPFQLPLTSSTFAFLPLTFMYIPQPPNRVDQPTAIPNTGANASLANDSLLCDETVSVCSPSHPLAFSPSPCSFPHPTLTEPGGISIVRD
jgi:hypothetical protein